MRRFGLGMGFLGAAALLSAACTLVVGRSGHQCDSDSECQALEGNVPSRCGAARVCEPIILPQLDAGGDASSSCTTNAECAAALGGPARCIQAQCVTLRSEDCTSIPGADYLSENAVYVGVLAPLRGENLNYGPSYIGAAWTAARALNANTSDIRRARPLVIIGCDETRDPARAARFLTDTVKVRAIVGPLFDSAVEAVLPATKNAGIPLFAPMLDNPKYAKVPNSDGLRWSCSPNRADATPAWSKAIQQVGDAAKAANGSPLKVFLATTREPGASAFANDLQAVLTFDGKSAADQTAAGNFKRIDYDFDPNTAPNVAGVVGEILAARPSVVVLTSLLGAASVIDAVEKGWNVAAGPKPYYLLHRTEPTISRRANVFEGADRKRRVFALDWARSSAVSGNAGRFAGAYVALNNTQAAWSAESAFDCTFAYAYGAYGAVGRQGGNFDTLLGTVLLPNIVALGSNGQAKNVGADDARSVVDTLLNTTLPVQVTGSASNLAMDGALGAPHADPELFCIDSNAAWRSAGVTYEQGTGTSRGTLNCP